MSFIDALLAVLTVIVFLVVVALVIALIIDLFLAIISPETKGLFFRRNASSKQKKPKMVENTEANTVSLEELENENKKEENKVNNWDESLVAAEQQQLLGNDVPQIEANTTEEKEQEIEARQQEMDDFDALFDEETPASEEDLNTMINEINEAAVAEFLNQPVEEQASEEQPAEEVKAEDEGEGDEGEALTESQPVAAENAETVEKVEEQPQEVVEEQPVKEDVVIPASIYATLTLEQLNARLEKLKDRLKLNEKELKANRKEYMPLARVKKTLERDEQKLRRREAIVARKKVILYGVNNYVDIDEEKAKKLSEDLDLLDGLRLSVQHCEDVMATNKDRFPLLETTNKILVQVNHDLKDDIAEVMDAIEIYKQTHPNE